MADDFLPNPRTLQGPLAELPALPDSSLLAKTSYQCTDVDATFYLAIVSGVQEWRRSGGSVLGPINLYVDGIAGNDANYGLTPATAVATNNRVGQLLPQFAGGQITVNYAPDQSYQGPDTPWSVPIAAGESPGPLVLLGALSDISGSVALSANGGDGLTLTFPRGTVVGTSVAQLVLEFIDGPYAGQQIRIATSTLVGGSFIAVMTGAFGVPAIGTHVRVLASNVTLTANGAGFALQLNGTGADAAGAIVSQINVVGGWVANGIEFVQDRSIFVLTDQVGYVRLHARVDGAPPIFSFLPSALIDAFCAQASGPSHGGSVIVLHYSEFFPGTLVMSNVMLYAHDHCYSEIDSLFGDNAPIFMENVSSLIQFGGYIRNVKNGNVYASEGSPFVAGADLDGVLESYDRCHWLNFSGEISGCDIPPVHAGIQTTFNGTGITGANASAPCGIACDGSSQVLIDAATTVTGSTPGTNDLRITANPRTLAGGANHSYADLAAASNKSLNDNQGNVIFSSG